MIPEDISGRRVVICDDHPTTRNSVVSECVALGLVVVGEAGKGIDCIDLVVSRKPDLLILDQQLQLPGMDGQAVLAAIREMNIPVKVLVFTGFTNSGSFFEWINHPDGPDGALDKGSSQYELRLAIQQVLVSNTKYIPESIRVRELGDGHNPLSKLGPRELDVIRLVAAGKRLPEVAKDLHLQPATVRTYMSSIYAKLGLGSNTLQGVTAAYHKWVAAGFVPPPDSSGAA